MNEASCDVCGERVAEDNLGQMTGSTILCVSCIKNALRKSDELTVGGLPVVQRTTSVEHDSGDTQCPR